MASSDDVRRGRRAQRLGANAESVVARNLRRHEWTVREQGDLQTATDIIAAKGTRKWFVQVKASEVGTPARPSVDELRRLRASAHRNGATAVVAFVTMTDGRARIEYTSAVDSRALKP